MPGGNETWRRTAGSHYGIITQYYDGAFINATNLAGSQPDWFDTTAMLAAAVERRVAYVPGSAFYPDGRGRDRMRLAFCYPAEDRILEGVARLGALLDDEAQLYRSLRGS